MSTLKKLSHLFSKKALSLTTGVAVGSMVLGLGVFAKPASAVTIGRVQLSNNGFATATYVDGNFIGTNGDVTGSLSDELVDTYAYAADGAGYVLFEFANAVLNDSGYDIALFDLESEDTTFKISIDGENWLEYGVSPTGETISQSPFYDIYVAKVDLSDFINPPEFVTSLLVDFGTANSPSLALVGTIQRSVPEPSTMFGLLATVGFLAYQRGLKFSKKA